MGKDIWEIIFPNCRFQEEQRIVAMVASKSYVSFMMRINRAVSPLMMVILSLSSFSCNSSPGEGAVSRAPPGENIWVQSYGGSGNDYSGFIEEMDNGGVLLAGSTDSFGYSDVDIWVLKLDGSGEVEWQKTYGGTGYDEVSSLKRTDDGGVILLGNTLSFGEGECDIWVLRLDSRGEISWERTYGGKGYDRGESLLPSGDGGFMLAGWTYSYGAGRSDIWVLKIDGDGRIDWQKTYGGPSYDYGNSIKAVRDGGYIVAGHTFSYGSGNSDYWVLKLKHNGDIGWQKTYGTRGNDYAIAATVTPSDNYIVAGQSDSFVGGDGGIWVLRLGPQGEVVWDKAYDGAHCYFVNDIGNSNSGAAIMTGQMYSHESKDFDAWIALLDEYGTPVWDRFFGDLSSIEFGESIRETFDGRYIVAGSRGSGNQGSSDIWIMKLEILGAVAVPETDIFPVTPLSGIDTMDTLVSGIISAAVEKGSSAVVTDTHATVTGEDFF